MVAGVAGYIGGVVIGSFEPGDDDVASYGDDSGYLLGLDAGVEVDFVVDADVGVDVDLDVDVMCGVVADVAANASANGAPRPPTAVVCGD